MRTTLVVIANLVAMFLLLAVLGVTEVSHRAAAITGLAVIAWLIWLAAYTVRRLTAKPQTAK